MNSPDRQPFDIDVATELLTQLIRIPSINPMGRPAQGPEFFETQLTEFLESWLRPLNLEVRRQPVSPGRDNLLATYHPPSADRHLLLEVHQDTVPVDGMTIDPFAATVKGDFLYGRGACDNKGPMTAMLLALRRLAETRPASSAKVTLALTVDEEHTFTGASRLARDLNGVTAAVVAEPTELDLVIAHKGVVRWEAIAPGRACHSSAPDQGTNAIYRMARVIGVLEQYAADLLCRPVDPLLGTPTMSVGRIDGGTAVNVVPDRCRIEIDRRLIPGEAPAAAVAEASARLRDDPAIDFDVEFVPPWLEVPPMGPEINAALAEAFGRAITAFRPGWHRRAVPFGTDASAFHAAGVPSIVFGPGSITKAHTKDEFVPLSEVVTAAAIYYDFCTHFG
jgi:acetylornithine deacetylase